MRFGNLAPMWFRYEPNFAGNRKGAINKRVSCEIKRLTMNEAMARYAPEVQGDARLWLRREIEKRYVVQDEDGTAHNVTTDEHIEMLDEGDREFVESLKLIPDEIAKDYQAFCRHTRNWKNCFVDDAEVSDPWDLFWHFYAVLDDDESRMSDFICREIYSTASMSKDELGNFKRSFAGSKTPTTSRSPKRKTAKQ